MLFLTFFFLLSAILLFQGVQALREPRDAWGVIPEPLKREPVRSAFWGSLLAASGIACLVLGLLSYAFPRLEAMLPGLQVGQFLVLGCYGIWTIFVSGRVVYQAKPSADAHHH